MKTPIQIGTIGTEQLTTTVESIFPLSPEWLERNGAVLA